MSRIEASTTRATVEGVILNEAPVLAGPWEPRET
jgi:hypothetical protein